MSQIYCSNLTVGYDNKIILENINLNIQSGDYVCIVGENGSGKSTLVKTILGLLPAISGNVSFDDGVKNTEIGYLPQQTIVQKDFPASVWEIVLSGCLSRTGLRPWYSRAEKNLAKENLEKLNIFPLKNYCYRELSGGQQQRVLLARALCSTQKVLILDEPVSGLDPKAANELYQIIKNLNKEGVTIVMISHDVSVANEYAKSILHIGKNIFFGSRADFFDNKALSNDFITRSN